MSLFSTNKKNNKDDNIENPSSVFASLNLEPIKIRHRCDELGIYGTLESEYNKCVNNLNTSVAVVKKLIDYTILELSILKELPDSPLTTVNSDMYVALHCLLERAKEVEANNSQEFIMGQLKFELFFQKIPLVTRSIPDYNIYITSLNDKMFLIEVINKHQTSIKKECAKVDLAKMKYTEFIEYIKNFDKINNYDNIDDNLGR